MYQYYTICTLLLNVVFDFYWFCIGWVELTWPQWVLWSRIQGVNQYELLPESPHLFVNLSNSKTDATELPKLNYESREEWNQLPGRGEVINPPPPGGGGGRIRPPLGFSGITSSFITVSTWNLAHLSGHQFGVVSCKENQNRPEIFCYRSNFVTSHHTILGR